ncbi:hypothetical protein ACHAWF_012120 [Thalassiosira exigua]
MTPSADISNPTSSDIRACLFLLLGLIEARQWAKFEEVAISDPKMFGLVSETVCKCVTFNGMTLLRACVRFDVPSTVLDQTIKLYPQALRLADCMGRTPLRVAAGSSSTPLVIKHLTVEYPQACKIQDEDGMTPLHFACDTTCQLFEDDQAASRGPPCLLTIRILLAGSLEAVVLDDSDGTNVVEYALLSGASMEVINLLQKASLRVLRASKNKKRKLVHESPLAKETSAMSDISMQ